MVSSRRRKRLGRKLLALSVLIWTMLILFICLQGFTNEERTVFHRIKSQVTEGYTRAKNLQDLCYKRGYNYKTSYVPIKLKYSTIDGSIQLCPIWKAGTTFIKRLFMIKTLKRFENITNPYQISFLEEFGKADTQLYNGTNSKRFIFARNPYDRLFSGYVDKLLAPNPVYWRIIGIPAIKYARPNPSGKSLRCGHDLTFREYVKYVTFVLQSSPVRGNARRKKGRRVGVSRDLHFAPMTEVCKPCIFKYNFVGKMETFSVDSLELIYQLNLSETGSVLSESGSNMAADDAIQDTAYQSFDNDFRSDILKCITIREALERSWEKLKIRGLIGEQELNLNENEAKALTYSEFLHHVKLARLGSTREERVKLKRNHFNQFYSKISDELLQNLALVYKEDFELFEYDSILERA